MSLRLDEPWYLAGLAALVPMAVVALRWMGGVTPVRAWSAIVLRGVLLALLIAMLAGASLVGTTDRAAVVAAIDASGSVRRFAPAMRDAAGREVGLEEAVRGFLAGASGSRRPDDVSGTVVFGRDAWVGAPMGPGWGFSMDQASGEGTDIARAIGLASAMLPPGAVRRIVLVSDGVATSGDAVRAARAAGVSIDVVPVEYRVDREVVVESVHSPPTAQAGSTVPVRIVLTSASTASGTLRLMHEDRAVALDGGETELRLTLEPGQTVRTVSVPLGDGRVHRFEAVWEPAGAPDGGERQDTILTNNRASSFTVAPGRGSVLVVDNVSGGDASGPGATLPAALRRAGLDVQVVAPEGLRAELLWLQAFDLVVMQNVPAESVAEPVQAALAEYVTRLGGGLVMVGGPDALGAGGWRGSTLEPLLPVLLDLPQRLVVPSMAVVIVLDNSGSMNRSVLGSDRSQMEIAGEGAALAIESMDKTDLLGVISFNSEHTVEIPLSPNADPAGAARRVRAIGADGGTFLPPALDEAVRQLKPVQAEIKHVIVLSDGVSQGKERLLGIAQRAAEANIRITSIAVGDDADGAAMAEIASVAGGRYYRVTDPGTLPRIFLRAIRVVRSPLVRERPFVPVVVGPGSPVLEGIGALPPLNGLVLTQPRPDATVVGVLATPAAGGSVSERGSGGEPVLAYWSAGVGRVGVFTSDAHRWAGPWLADGGGVYARFWAQLARTIARPATSRTQVLTLDAAGDRITARLEASTDDGRPLDLLDVPATVYGPTGARAQLRLAQVGPGEYEGATPAGFASESGVYVVTLAPRQGARALAPVVGGVSRPAGEEFLRLSSDRAALEAIAAATGGRVLSLNDAAAADVFNRAGARPAEARTDLWRTLALWAVVVMLLDVATRRIAWDRLVSRRLGADLKRQAAEAVRQRGGEAEAAVGRLRRRDEAVETALGSQPSPGPLTDEDARALARSEADRRRLARDAARRRAREAADATDPASPARSAEPPSAPAAPPAAEEADEPGLLAAKRRARRKMDE